MQIEIDAQSPEYRELLEGYLNKKTFTIEQGGETLTGCRVTDIQMNFTPGNIIATVTIEQAKVEIVSTPKGGSVYHDLFEQDYSKLEARTLAWLHEGGDPVDMNAKSFYQSNRVSSKSMYPTSKEIHKRLNLADRWGVGEERRKQFAIEKLNLHPAQYEFFKAGRGNVALDFKDGVLHSHHDINLGAHYKRIAEYDKGGPWKHPGVAFYPNRKLRFGELEMKNWKFKSVHPKDIDFEELGESVTRQNPLALVRGSYTRQARVEENYVVVHKSILDKAMVCAIGRPTPGNWKATMNGGRVYRNVPTKDLTKWVKWAKDVRAAKWDDNERRKVTFEVDLPTI